MFLIVIALSFPIVTSVIANQIDENTLDATKCYYIGDSIKFILAISIITAVFSLIVFISSIIFNGLKSWWILIPFCIIELGIVLILTIPPILLGKSYIDKCN